MQATTMQVPAHDVGTEAIAMARAAQARAQAVYDRAEMRLGEASVRLFEALKPLRVIGATEAQRDAVVVARADEQAARKACYRAAALHKLARREVAEAIGRNAGMPADKIAKIIALIEKHD